VGDSRVILGYKKDISPYPDVPTDTPGTTPDDESSIQISVPHQVSPIDDKDTSSATPSAAPSATPSALPTSNKDGDISPLTPANGNAVTTTEVVLEEVDNRLWGRATTVALSTDHKPDDPKERACIVAAGNFCRSSASHTPSNPLSQFVYLSLSLILTQCDFVFPTRRPS
jgi:hypothetical protein